jgi:hypothetical protein
LIKISGFLFPSGESKNKVECQFCGYIIAKPFPKDQNCPKCRKFLAILQELATNDTRKTDPKQFKTKTATLSSKLKGKVKVKEKSSDISLGSDIIELEKGEYIKLLGITSVERIQLYCSNEKLRYLLELTNNLDFIATGVLGGVLEKMRLISVADKSVEKCQFYVKDDIIYLVYGNFPDKKGKWLLKQMSKNFELVIEKLVKEKVIRDIDVNNLNGTEINQIEFDFYGRAKLILKEYLNLQEVFTDQDLTYVDDTLRIDYLGLSSMSIGVISLILGDDLNFELQMEVHTPEEEKEMKESMLTARIEAIAANTQGNTGAIPRWIAVKLGFQKYRFLTFKKYQNDYFLSLLSEGDLGKIEDVEELLEIKINEATRTPFSGNLKPFNELKESLGEDLKKRRKFPPFAFT